jgi:hypothetical protein
MLVAREDSLRDGPGEAHFDEAQPEDRAHHRAQMPWSRALRLACLLALALALALGGCGAMQLMADGDARDLRRGLEPATPTGAPTVLIIALDGVGRGLLYGMLARGELPELAGLLGGSGEGGLPHAHLDDTVLSVLPSSTLAAWASVFTGAPPAVHGVAGNEYFVREERRLAAPAPVSVSSTAPVIATYAEGYVNALIAVPTLYERLRARDPDTSVWVSMSQIHRGADRLLLPDGSVVGDVFGAFVAGLFEDDDDLSLYAQLDRNAIENVTSELSRSAAPRVLTVYLPGPDLYAHGAAAGPDVAIGRYLREVLDPLLAELRAALAARDALADRYVVVVADHGHTAVIHDDEHALSTGDGPDDPAAVVRGAGFRLRPFELDVGEDVDFDAVLAYGGAMAYAYVADRSTCPAIEAPAAERDRPRSRRARQRARAAPVEIAEPLESAPVERCDWSRPARYEGDVIPMADAFFRASAEGLQAPGMRGTLDLVLVREPRPIDEDAAPFEVYVGDGRTEPIDAHLAAHPRRAYVAVEARLRDLAVGPRGHRAGDVLLIARNGDEADVASRYYFATPYRSWHGSPSRADSEIPLIVAHPGRTAGELARRTRAALGQEPRQTDLASLIESLLHPTRDSP